ncbi:MAG TPA: hypothetical protein VMV64_03440 [Sulfuricella sp.]|nr:hypothetical protein [Sulfuricella sp.]HUX62789.1 hypothetical protein [Sulfuricella sp.]
MPKQKNRIEIYPLRTEDDAAAMMLWQGCDGYACDRKTLLRRFFTALSPEIRGYALARGMRIAWLGQFWLVTIVGVLTCTTWLSQRRIDGKG